ncbi:MAG: hypothetical protein Kow0075_13400 [Salibacteraceae bacterium]
MRLHKEGRVSLALAAMVSLALVVGAHLLTSQGHFARPVAIGAAAILLAVILQFFRSPFRRPVSSEADIISPADGKVVVVEEVYEPEYFKDNVTQVSIFMSPVNVHINWIPVSGEVVYAHYHPGKYLVAWHPKSSTDNERHTVVIRNDFLGDVLVRQIAGAMARRIVNYVEAGDEVVQGDELGFIKFGSRVDVLFDKSAEVLVQIGDRVTGRQTILATSANHSGKLS